MKKLFIILVIFVLNGCLEPAIGSGEVKVTDTKVEVEWLEINPPPNVEGPCYAYFILKNGRTSEATGYSGVWCK